jgi:hypothetical protein
VWIWRGRDEEFRTVEKSHTVPGVQKFENTCFWDFHIPTEMAQRVWAPSFFKLSPLRSEAASGCGGSKSDSCWGDPAGVASGFRA